jgi:hypothetical protein
VKNSAQPKLLSIRDEREVLSLRGLTQRTEESAQLRYLNGEEVTDVLSNGAQVYKEVVVMEEKANSPGEIKKFDGERKTKYHGNAYVS